MHTELVTFDQLDGVMDVVKTHPYPPYDCSFEDYSSFIKVVYEQPEVRIWGLFVDDKVVGYLIGHHDRSGILNQVFVYDFCLMPDYRKQKYGVLLALEVMDWARGLGVKRIAWVSRWPMDHWESFVDIKVERRYYYEWEVE